LLMNLLKGLREEVISEVVMTAEVAVAETEETTTGS
jgi:hypothetical protein